MDVGAWLRKLGLGQYEPAFRDNDVDAEVLPELTAEDLIGLGVSSIGHRRKLLAAIAALRDGAPSPSAASPQPGPEPTVASVAAARSTETERRQLTVMFVDLVGSTALSHRLDPEDLREIIAAYHGCCAEVIGRFEGHVAKFLGDGILAYFGYPRAHEDDAERAVRAGLELVEAVKGLKPRADSALRVRVGVATGLVVVGDLIGAGAVREAAAVGETPNLAERLQVLAEPDSVVISPSTRRLTGGLFEYADLGPHDLKGFAAPVQAWRALGPSPAEGRFEARRAAGLTPLVGREEEIALLLDRWARAKRGEGQVVLLSGEAGVGKSRLLRALRERLAGEPYMPLSHYCSPFHQTSALHPVIGLLERAAGFARDDPPERKLDKLEALLARTTEDVSEAAPLLAALLALPPGDRYPPLALGPQRQKERTLASLVAQLAGLAARQPVLAVYEDVHWSDPTTLELLELVIERVQRLPVLAMITFRLEFTPPWRGRVHTTGLALNRLSRRRGAALVAELTGGKALPPEVLEQIVARADGVPLFVEELTKAVLESGLLRETDGAYVLDGPLPPLAIPTTLHDSLMARLDRLAPVKEVAQVAAVIGREFSHELLAAVAPLGDNELPGALEQLTRAELVFCRGTPPEATYSFKHALVRDAAYQSLLKSRRQRLHARIARVLEERFPGIVETQPEVLAHHCTEAGLYEAAVAYWQRAGQRAKTRSALAEAVTHLTKGLEVLRGLPDGPERDQQEIDLQINLGVALIPWKGRAAPETGRAYTRARELCLRIGDTDRLLPVLYGLCTHYGARAIFDAAREAAEELLRLGQQQGDVVTAQVIGHRILGATLVNMGEFGLAREHLGRAISLYDPTRHSTLAFSYAQDPRLAATAWLAWALLILGHPDQARARHREALTEARELDHPNTLAQTLFCGCMVQHLLRDRSEVAELSEALIPLSKQWDFPFWSAIATTFKGWALAQGPGLERGVDQMWQGLTACRATAAEVWVPYFLGLLAEAHRELGQPVKGLALLSKARKRVKRTNERWAEAELHRCRGELLLALPKPHRAGAEACFRQALAVAREQGARLWELRAAASLGRLWREQGKRAEARAVLAPVYGWFDEGFDTPDLREARALLDELASAPHGSRAGPRRRPAAPVNNPG